MPGRAHAQGVQGAGLSVPLPKRSQGLCVQRNVLVAGAVCVKGPLGTPAG